MHQFIYALRCYNPTIYGVSQKSQWLPTGKVISSIHSMYIYLSIHPSMHPSIIDYWHIYIIYIYNTLNSATIRPSRRGRLESQMREGGLPARARLQASRVVSHYETSTIRYGNDTENSLYYTMGKNMGK